MVLRNKNIRKGGRKKGWERHPVVKEGRRKEKSGIRTGQNDLSRHRWIGEEGKGSSREKAAPRLRHTV